VLGTKRGNDRSKVEEYWSEVDCSASERNFYCFPPIARHACKLVFGKSDPSGKEWSVSMTVEKSLKERIPFDDTLSICCGFGHVERILSRLNVSRNITGIDIAPRAIEEAKNRAKKENLRNIEYRVADLNSMVLPENGFDLIWSNGALHHIEAVERAVQMLYNALKHDGYLIATEYVGPRYQQLPNRQQEIINAVKHLLPPDLRDSNPRKSRGSWGWVLEGFVRWFLRRKDPAFDRLWGPAPIRQFLRTDPSECISSDRVIPALKSVFQEIEVNNFGGSIMSYAFDDTFYNNFDMTDINHRNILEMVFGIEETLTETNELAINNAHIICRKS